ncbi:MAG: hypothetical protein U9N57_07260 [Pseudomonadota bacterium]|nr:hypothetical protein [Pseudomonadota bacterium]
MEAELGVKAKKNLLPQRTGDVLHTFACIKEFEEQFGVLSKTSVSEGVQNFIGWYLKYYQTQKEFKLGLA